MFMETPLASHACWPLGDKGGGGKLHLTNLYSEVLGRRWLSHLWEARNEHKAWHRADVHRMFVELHLYAFCHLILVFQVRRQGLQVTESLIITGLNQR